MISNFLLALCSILFSLFGFGCINVLYTLGILGFLNSSFTLKISQSPMIYNTIYFVTSCYYFKYSSCRNARLHNVQLTLQSPHQVIQNEIQTHIFQGLRILCLLCILASIHSKHLAHGFGFFNAYFGGACPKPLSQHAPKNEVMLTHWAMSSKSKSWNPNVNRVLQIWTVSSNSQPWAPILNPELQLWTLSSIGATPKFTKMSKLHRTIQNESWQCRNRLFIFYYILFYIICISIIVFVY